MTTETPSCDRLALWARAARCGAATDEVRAFVAAGGIDSIASDFCAQVGVSLLELLSWQEHRPPHEPGAMVLDLMLDEITAIAYAPVLAGARTVEEWRRVVRALEWLYDTLTPAATSPAAALRRRPAANRR